MAWAGLLAMLLLPGCIYETALEAGPSENVDTRFVGTLRPAEDKNSRMVIRAFDGKQYLVVTIDGKEVDTYRAFTSEVDGLRLASIQTLAPGKTSNGKWAVFAYHLNGKGYLVVRLLNEKVISPNLNSPEKLRQAIRKNRKNPLLFLKESIYLPVKK